jgi:hypothetical protein
VIQVETWRWVSDVPWEGKASLPIQPNIARRIGFVVNANRAALFLIDLQTHPSIVALHLIPVSASPDVITHRQASMPLV